MTRLNREPTTDAPPPPRYPPYASMPPPPPAPDRPTRDSSRKSFPKELNRLWQMLLSFIDWYHEFKFMPGRVRFVPITNTDDKFLGKQIKVRRNLLYPFYGNKEIITIEPITAKTKNKPKRKANHPAEQMATLGELFDGYEDIDRERGTPHTMGGGR